MSPENIEKVVEVVEAVVPGPNSSLWSMHPLLGSVPGRDYYGRVFVEVWEKDAHMAVDLTIPNLEERALAALRNQDASIRVTDTPWTNEPATGELPSQTFLGRVVVEVWDGQAVVAITGSDLRVLQKAMQILEDKQSG